MLMFFFLCPLLLSQLFSTCQTTHPNVRVKRYMKSLINSGEIRAKSRRIVARHYNPKNGYEKDMLEKLEFKRRLYEAKAREEERRKIEEMLEEEQKTFRAVKMWHSIAKASAARERLNNKNKKATLTKPQQFKQCCRKDPLIEKSCYNLCKFDAITKSSLIKAFFYGKCAKHSLGPILRCASGSEDHRKCCKRSFGNEKRKCVNFCDPTNRMPPVHILYYSCLKVVDSIMQCFAK